MEKRFIAFLILVGGLCPYSVVSAFTTTENELDENTGKNDVEYTGPLAIKLGTRVDYVREYQQTDAVDEACGFKGNNLMISIQGNITNRISFRYRQRISQLKYTDSFFDGTDFMFLKYAFNNRWDITGGKVAIEFGSAEYQRDPSEQYILSDHWNNMSCYKFGVNLGFNASENDRLVAQVAESPFKRKGLDLYAYALSWYGNHNWFHTMYSANLMEYQKGKFVYVLSLGNRLEFDKFAVNFDYMNRPTGKHDFFKDCTVRGELMVYPNKHFNVVGIALYNTNKTHDFQELYMKKGTELTHFGGVVEYLPIPDKDKTLKIHAAYNYYYGQVGVKNEAPSLNRHMFTIGAQWEMDIVALAKKIWNKY